MPKKREIKPVKIRFPGAYIYAMLANRFAIQRDEGFTLVQFGLVDSSNTQIDSFPCVFSEFTLESQKENLVQYSDTLPPPKTTVPHWPFKKPEKKLGQLSELPVIDFVHVTHWADKYAEICLMNYSQAQASDLSRAGEEEMMAWGVALIRCHIDLQSAFLRALYDTDRL